jgi:hypothetical protein
LVNTIPAPVRIELIAPFTTVYDVPLNVPPLRPSRGPR